MARAYVKNSVPTETSVKELAKNVQGFLESTAALVALLSKPSGPPTGDFYSLTCRLILRRQYDNLSVVTDLALTDKGHATGPLLRSSCEELIWMEYLQLIGSTHANELVRNLLYIDIADTVEKQQNFLTNEIMRQLGFPKKYVSQLKQSREIAKKKLSKLGESELGWNMETMGKKTVPSTEFMIGAVANIHYRKVYYFLWGILSSFVHFRMLELSRRADLTSFRQGIVLINSTKFNIHWCAFSLYWGWFIYNRVFEKVLKLGLDQQWLTSDGVDKQFMNKLIHSLEHYRNSIQEHGTTPAVAIDELLTKDEAEKLYEIYKRGGKPYISYQDGRLKVEQLSGR